MSVIADPVASPAAFFKMMFAPETDELSAVTAISSERILLNTPFPVTVTAFVSTVPSMKSTTDAPLISKSRVFANVLSVKVRSPEPAVSIPTALPLRVIESQDKSLLVAEPNLSPAPVEPEIDPVRSPARSFT